MTQVASVELKLGEARCSNPCGCKEIGDYIAAGDIRFRRNSSGIFRYLIGATHGLYNFRRVTRSKSLIFGGVDRKRCNNDDISQLTGRVVVESW
jgi:hypothetical protein